MTTKMDSAFVYQDAHRLRNFWFKRTIKIQEWYRLRRMVDRYKMQGYESVVSNDPKTLFNLSQYILSALPAKHKIPLMKQDAEQQDKAGKTERAFISLWREQDELMISQLRRPWRWELNDFMLMTGWYAVQVAVVSDGGKPKFVADVWNPAEVYQEPGEFGLGTVARIYRTTRGQARSKAEANEWEVPANWRGDNQMALDSQPMDIIDYWRQTGNGAYHAVLYDNIDVLPYEDSGFKKIPVLTGPSGGEAAWGGYGAGGFQEDFDWTENYGESVLEPNAGLFEATNKYLSLALQIVHENAQPVILDRNRGARKLVTAEDVRAGRVIHMEIDQAVEPMRKPEFEKELFELLGAFGAMEQRGGFPWVLYGNVPATLDLSGFAIGMLMTAAQNVVGPYHAMQTAIMGMVDRIWAEEYRGSGLSPIQIAGRTKGGDLESLFFEDFGPDDIPDCTFVDVTIPLATPSDLVQRMAIARQAKPLGDILDHVTLLDELNLAQDPQLVIERLQDDVAREHPAMQQLEMVMGMVRHEAHMRSLGQNAEADVLATVWNSILASMSQPPPGQGSAPNGLPPPEAGLEAARGISPSLARQVAGTPPPQRGAEEAGRTQARIPGRAVR